MFGCMGALCFVLGWPLVLLLDWAHWELFEWPSRTVAATLLANGLLGSVLPDLIWARAVVLGSPTVATIGLSLTIPMAMAFDAMHKGFSSSIGMFSTQWLGGTLMVWLAFVSIDLDEESDANYNESKKTDPTSQ